MCNVFYSTGVCSEYVTTGWHQGIGSEKDLNLLVARIMEGEENGEVREIALDLEAQSHRAFAGLVYLIHLSIHCPPPIV